jgi:hypothetical protein
MELFGIIISLMLIAALTARELNSAALNSIVDAKQIEQLQKIDRYLKIIIFPLLVMFTMIFITEVQEIVSRIS